MPTGIYPRTPGHNQKIKEAKKGKKRPKVKKAYEHKKKEKYPFDPQTAHGEKINRGKKSYKEYIKEAIKKNPQIIKTGALKNIRWFEKVE